MKNKIGLIVIITALVSIGTTLLVNHLAGNEKNVEKVYVSSGQEPVIRQVSLPEVQYPDFTYAAETGVKAVVHVKVEKRGQAVQGPQSLFDFFFGYGTPAGTASPRGCRIGSHHIAGRIYSYRNPCDRRGR